jgi:hypothetical protein
MWHVSFPHGAAVALRTFPLLVEPIQREVFDSWLEAVAARHDAPFAEIMRRCDIPLKALRDTWFGLLSKRGSEDSLTTLVVGS